MYSITPTPKNQGARVTSVAMPFAPLVQRFTALCIDALLALVAIIIVGLSANPAVGLRDSVGYAPMLALLAAWFALFPATPLRGTPGKRLAGLKITGMDGRPIGIGRSLARFTLSLLTVATFGLGFVAALWSGKRQALHDLGARTLVVERKFRPEEIAGAVAPPADRVTRLLGVIFLPCFLVAAWTPISVYMSMRKRTEITIAILAVRPFQKEVEKAMLEGTSIPVPPANPDRRIRALTVQPGGKVVIELAEDLNPDGRISLTPARTTKGIEWKCTSENLRRVHLGALCPD